MPARITLTLVVWVLGAGCLNAQDHPSVSLIATGLEVEAYPAGFILGARGDVAVSPKVSMNLRLGYNFARRRDLGKHLDEKGGGPGFSLGARYYLKPEFEGFFAGVRLELWALDIDWKDVLPNDEPRTGTTEITVLQPLVEGGYTFLVGDKNWGITPKITLGYEINIKTRGEKVGEGAISLLGVTFSRRF